MGLCLSCGKSKDRFKDKGSKICGHIHSAVTPLHLAHEAAALSPQNNINLTNGHLPVNNQHNHQQYQNHNHHHLHHHHNHHQQLLNQNNKEHHQHHNQNNHRGGSSNGSTRKRAKRNDSMAASFHNMNITNPIRGLVSKNRNRYKQDGFNLDLTYIKSNIIAMGYPASNIEGVYRNHIDDVVKFLDRKHCDRYFIYNLCSERCYDKSKFHDRVQSFPFDDHNPPKIELIRPFCESVHNWLTQHPENVAVVHCKAGKGRTGTMICCYLLHSGIFATADEALNYYGQTRTQDRKGVTIPSQVRYVRYYETLIRNNLDYVSTPMNLKEIILQPIPNFTGGQGYLRYSISEQRLEKDSDDGQQQQQQQQQLMEQQHQQQSQQQPFCTTVTSLGTTATQTTANSGGTCNSSGVSTGHKQTCVKLIKSGLYEIKKGVSNFVFTLNYCKVLSGDIKVEFYHKSKIGRKERVFQFWFNTFFVVLQAESINGYIEQNGSASCDQTYCLTLKKDELDIVSKKDKQNRVFSADFQVTLLLQKIPTNGNQSQWQNYSSREIPRLPQDTPSESSEAESSEADSNEEGWESVVDGETLDPRGVGYRILSECEIASQLTSSSSEQPELLTA